MTRRRLIIGALVFIFAGLIIYTFANPGNNESNNKDNNTNETTNTPDENNLGENEFGTEGDLGTNFGTGGNRGIQEEEVDYEEDTYMTHLSWIPAGIGALNFEASETALSEITINKQILIGNYEIGCLENNNYQGNDECGDGDSQGGGNRRVNPIANLNDEIFYYIIEGWTAQNEYITRTGNFSVNNPKKEILPLGAYTIREDESKLTDDFNFVGISDNGVVEITTNGQQKAVDIINSLGEIDCDEDENDIIDGVCTPKPSDEEPNEPQKPYQISNTCINFQDFNNSGKTISFDIWVKGQTNPIKLQLTTTSTIKAEGDNEGTWYYAEIPASDKYLKFNVYLFANENNIVCIYLSTSSKNPTELKGITVIDVTPEPKTTEAKGMIQATTLACEFNILTVEEEKIDIKETDEVTSVEPKAIEIESVDPEGDVE